MDPITYLIILLATILIMELTRPKPEDARPPGLGDFEIPTASQDRKVPVIWGKPWLNSPNLVWWGALYIHPIKRRIKGLFTSQTQIIGYMFYFGMHLVAAMSGPGSPRLLKIAVDKDDVFVGDLAIGDGEIIQPLLFGGQEGQGGILGHFGFLPGGSDQAQDQYLLKTLGPRVPAYRDVISIIWKGGYMGNSKYIKPWAFQISRCPDQLSIPGGGANIDDEANPAEIVFEILTNQFWGMALPVSKVDLCSFTAAGKLFAEEGFGLSLVWDRSKTIESVLDEIRKYTESTIYMNVLDGKYYFKPNRKLLVLNRETCTYEETTVENLPTFDVDNCKVENISRPTIDELVNEVKIIYTNLEEKKDKPVVAQELALYQAQDRAPVSVELQYKGITKSNLALQTAARELKTMSYPLVAAAIKTNRQAYKLTPGDRFVLNWEPEGISDMVMIVEKITYGEVTDNKITIDAIQDIFELGDVLYADPDSLWEPVDTSAQEVEDYVLDEVPHLMNVISDEGYVFGTHRPMILAEDPTGNSLGYRLYYKSGLAAYQQSESVQTFTPFGLLQQDYKRTDPVDSSQTLVITLPPNIIPYEDVTDDEIRLSGKNLIMINKEIIAVKTSTLNAGSGTLTVDVAWRGVLDTTTGNHAAGDKVYFISSGIGTTTETYVEPTHTDWYYRLATVAVNGALDFPYLPDIHQPITYRASKAYPVMDVKVNTASVPDFVVGDTVIDFEFRNRLNQTEVIPQTDPGDVFEGSIREVTLNFYDDDDVLQATIVHNPTALATSGSETLLQSAEAGWAGPGRKLEIITTSDSIDAYDSEIIYYQRPVTHPGGDLYELITEETPEAYWGLEE